MNKINLLSRMLKPGTMCLGIVMMLSAGVLSSCSDDDEGGTTPPTNLETPAYESVSAKYEITSSSSGIQSIELTASGNYIITYGQGASVQAYSADATAQGKPSAKNILASKPATRAGEQYISGKFVKISDTEFILEGFGSIVIDGAADNAFSIQVTPSTGETYTLSAEKATTIADSEMTNALCRTWNINTVRMTLTMNGNTRFDKTRPTTEYAQLWRDLNTAMAQLEEEVTGEPSEGDFFDIPEYTPADIVFTKAGTYMVTATENYLSVSMWQWENEGNGTIRYSHNYADMNAPQYSNTADVTFNGDKITVSETNMDENDEGIRLQIKSYYECSEAK